MRGKIRRARRRASNVSSDRFGRRDARTARSCVPPAPARRAPRAVRSTVRGAARGGATSRRRARRTPRPDRFGRRDARTVRSCAPPGPRRALRVRLPARGVVGGGRGEEKTFAAGDGRVGGLEVNKQARRASHVHLREVLTARERRAPTNSKSPEVSWPWVLGVASGHGAARSSSGILCEPRSGERSCSAEAPPQASLSFAAHFLNYVTSPGTGPLSTPLT